jgi:contractile injection system tube protein
VSDFPGSPRLLKGALVVFEAVVPVPTNIIAFQYNPDSVSRTFQQQQSASAGDPRRNAGDTQHVLPPTESLRMSVELDATDQLEGANPLAIATGLHPTLAALELLLYPPSTDIILGKILSAVGSARVSPAKAPLVLLVWGPLRVIPVRVESVSITEEAFDQLLNPIRAKVELGLRTLTEKELKTAGAPFDTIALVNLIAKEVLARTAAFTSVIEIGGSVSVG